MVSRKIPVVFGEKFIGVNLSFGNTSFIELIYMVYVAERLRRQFVALVYAGSNPVVHPNILKETLVEVVWLGNPVKLP